MRIAISGSHRSGKSTLVEELTARLPGHSAVAEPYEKMIEDGYVFSHPPSLEDLEAQLALSLGLLDAGDENVVFDRSPVDFLGYLRVHPDADLFELERWLPRVRDSVRSLDLVVFVPVEEEDRIVLTSSDRSDRSREEVDEELRELVVGDSLDLGLEVLEIAGRPSDRAEAVLEWLGRESP